MSDQPTASDVAPGADPWDVNVPPLLIDDKVITGEPSFVHVAICMGSDMKSNPIELIDRMCLNGPAVKLVLDNTESYEQQLTKTESEYETCQLDLRSARDSADRWTTASVGLIFGIVVVALLAAIVARKNS